MKQEKKERCITLDRKCWSTDPHGKLDWRRSYCLHFWHGPYVVQQQITPLNYEIRLIPGKKTEIVHVERLKKFTDPIRMDQGLEQADTNTKDTPSPSTEPARKSVRFEHHATEDDTADQEEPTTTSNTEETGTPKTQSQTYHQRTTSTRQNWRLMEKAPPRKPDNRPRRPQDNSQTHNQTNKPDDTH